MRIVRIAVILLVATFGKGDNNGKQVESSDWAEDFVLMQNEAIRFLLSKMERSVNSEYFTQAKMASFHGWYTAYCGGVLKAKLGVVETVYFSSTRTKTAIPKSVTDKVTGNIAVLEDTFKPNAKGTTLGQLVKRVNDLCVAMRHLLLVEEENIPPILRQSFSEAQEMDLAKDVLLEFGTGVKVFIPLVFKMAEESWNPSAAIRTKFPRLILALHDYVWRFDMHFNNIDVIDSLSYDSNSPAVHHHAKLLTYATHYGELIILVTLAAVFWIFCSSLWTIFVSPDDPDSNPRERTKAKYD